MTPSQPDESANAPCTSTIVGLAEVLRACAVVTAPTDARPTAPADARPTAVSTGSTRKRRKREANMVRVLQWWWWCVLANAQSAQPWE